MVNATKHAGATVIGLLLSAIQTAYMVFIRVPSVMEVRPRLAEVGLVTGLFSGRGEVYLYHEYTVPMVILSTLGIVVIINLLVLSR